jgi:hypothetical protein
MADCHWARQAPAGLCDEAEGWGIERLADVFVRAHRPFKDHDDGTGHCKVCGTPIDWEAWLRAQDREERIET